MATIVLMLGGVATHAPDDGEGGGKGGGTNLHAS